MLNCWEVIMVMLENVLVLRSYVPKLWSEAWRYLQLPFKWFQNTCVCVRVCVESVRGGRHGTVLKIGEPTSSVLGATGRFKIFQQKMLGENIKWTTQHSKLNLGCNFSFFQRSIERRKSRSVNSNSCITVNFFPSVHLKQYFSGFLQWPHPFFTIEKECF